MRMIKEFFRLEGSAGILLCFTAIIALIMNNSSLEEFYNGFLTVPVMIQIGEFTINKPLLLWINDGLMAIFFFLIGLEIKREILEGQLSSKDKLMLPAFAALGGILFPALIYSYINWGDGIAMKGWAIPAATDIAFALGVLTLLGNRVPESLKIALVAVAILDDLAAIIIIALFYTENLSLFSLAIGIIAVVILTILNRKNITDVTPYIVVGIFFWACVLKSGVHATLAGVILAMFIPIRDKNNKEFSPLRKLEHSLHPWVAYMILPIFAFANAGVSLEGLSLEKMLNPITLGIALGLFIGKQLGVMLLSFIAVKLKFCSLPEDVNWKQFYAMSLITGIGFTMSLFIGTLAFEDIENQTAVRLGVLCGSILSGVLGYLILRLYSPKQVENLNKQEL